MLQGKRIYIVEDNAANRTIQQMLLEERGAITTFESWGQWGEDTIRRIRNFMPVDLILLDLMLSNRVSGFDVFKLIRAQEDLQHIPVVAVSATNPSEGIAMAQELGFNGFISKPVKYDTFADLLVDVLNGKPVWSGR